MSSQLTPSQGQGLSLRLLGSPTNHLLGLCVLLAFYTGFRMPSLWSINYYLPSFMDGFYRRSLVGTLLYPLGDLRFSYLFIAAIQMAVLVVLLALLIRAVLRADERTKLISCLFFLGPFGGYLFHEVGYIDQLLFLVLMAALEVDNKWGSRLLVVASLFMHEMALFLLVPLYAVCRYHERKDLREVVVTVAMALLGFLVILLFCQTASNTVIFDFLRAIRSSADYRVRSDYYLTVFPIKLTGDRVANYYHADFIKEVMLCASLAAMAGWTWASREKSRLAMMASFCAGCVAGCSPLLLGLFGFDVYRWIFLSAACSVFALYKLRDVGHEHAQYGAMIVLVLFLAVVHIGYFDFLEPRALNLRAVVDFLAYDLMHEIRAAPVD